MRELPCACEAFRMWYYSFLFRWVVRAERVWREKYGEKGKERMGKGWWIF
jgi:hypothetical protein